MPHYFSDSMQVICTPPAATLTPDELHARALALAEKLKKDDPGDG